MQLGTLADLTAFWSAPLDPREGSLLAPEWRLFAVTGFLGGLTTFSTFSGESLALMQKGDFTAAAIHSAVHLLGCLAAAAIGFRLMR